jgi:hypothetical protein
MKKTLITILIIVILAGVGYFAYSKGLIDLGFLKKGDESVIEVEDVKIESDEEAKLISDLNFTHSDDPYDDYSIALIKGNFATGGAFGARYIAIKKDGKWSILASFQDDPSCKILKENNVPTEIYDGSCYDEKFASIEPQILGKYVSLNNDDNYITLNNDGSFINNRPTQASGKFFIDGLKIKFVYDDKSPDVSLEIKDGYISGTDSQGIDYTYTKQDITLKSNPSYFYRRISIPYTDNVEYNLFKIENSQSVYKGTLRFDGTMEFYDGSGFSGRKVEIYKGIKGINNWQNRELIDEFAIRGAFDIDEYFNENYKKFE